MECIQQFSVREQLGDTERYQCSGCSRATNAWKQLRLYRPPPVLVVHLKRFEHGKPKIEDPVDFPLVGLDLRNVMRSNDGERESLPHWDEGKEPIYDCYAVSNHFGQLNHGHYTAFAKGRDGKWSGFDDRCVFPITDERKDISPAAYCIFYKRRDVVWDTNSFVGQLEQDEVSAN